MNRNAALDVLKLGLAFMVVGLHVGMCEDISPLARFMTADGVFRMAVPLFLIINGYYFYPVLSKDRFAVWLRRVVALYLFWMLVYVYFWFRPSVDSPIENIRFAQAIVFGYHHLWYIVGLIGAGIVVYLLRRAAPPILWITIAATYVGGVAMQYAGNYHVFGTSALDDVCNFTCLHRNFLFLAFPYFGLGFLIHKVDFTAQLSTKTALLLSMLGFLLLCTEAYLNFQAPGREGDFDNFASLILFCPAVFLLFMKLNVQGDGKRIALYAAGVYFIHPLFTSFFSTFTTLGETALTFVVFGTSFIASYFLIKLNEKWTFIL